MLGIGIEIHIEYFESEGDGRKCSTCGDPILGKMFSLVVFNKLSIETLPNVTDSKYNYCEPCYDAIQKDEE